MTDMANRTGLVEHRASVVVNAPAHQVYALFTHFNDFPKFMSFVKEVTYYDDQRSHWVADVVGRHEWDAVNENWVSDQQLGWRSTKGLENAGLVTFQPANSNQTRIDVMIAYKPPLGVLGDAGERLGAGQRFDNALQHDLDNFARMVDQAPPGALDPTSSNYLFHGGSAAAKGTTTSRQNATMGDRNDAYTGSAYGDRPLTDRDIINEPPYPNNAGTGMGSTGSTYNPNAPVSPHRGINDPVMPPDRGASNPVLPPDSDTTY